MNTVEYGVKRRIPVTHEVDVAVVGGGPGGLGAAVIAARCGAKVLLIERYGYLGGMAASGEVHPFMNNHVDGKALDGPVYGEWIEAMKRYQPQDMSEFIRPSEKERMINKHAAMLAAEDLCLEAGAELLYHHALVDVAMTERRIDCAVLHSKSGFTAVRARQFVDCTGDADLASLAGCAFECGGPSGHCQPMTLCFKLGNVDRAAAEAGGMRKLLNQAYQEAKTAGEVDCPREDILSFNWYEADVVHFNTTRVVKKSAIDGGELSEAEIEARRQLRQLLRLFRAKVPGFENATLLSVAHHIGVRESRRVRGLAYLTREDFTNARKFPDAVARVRYPIDIHNPNGSGTEIVCLPEGDWYEIPYGCVVARDAENLTVGGRPISVDHAVHSSMRVMPPAITVGQAAGLAAAVSAARRINPRDLGGTEVRRLLTEKGARLDEARCCGK